MDRTAQIRIATRADVSALFELVKAFATSFVPERAGFEGALHGVLSDEAARLTVATADGLVVGYCLGFDHFAFYASGRVSWVEEIMVLENWRRRGIARSLMSDFEVWARARQSRLIGLATRRAASFYDALGYEHSATFFRKLL